MGCSVRWRVGCLTCFGEFLKWFKGGSMKQSRLQIPVRPYDDDCWIELSFQDSPKLIRTRSQLYVH